MVLRVWDGFFLRGEIYIIQVALALLKYLEPKIRFVREVYYSLEISEAHNAGVWNNAERRQCIQLTAFLLLSG